MHQIASTNKSSNYAAACKQNAFLYPEEPRLGIQWPILAIQWLPWIPAQGYGCDKKLKYDDPFKLIITCVIIMDTFCVVMQYYYSVLAHIFKCFISAFINIIIELPVVSLGAICSC